MPVYRKCAIVHHRGPPHKRLEPGHVVRNIRRAPFDRYGVRHLQQAFGHVHRHVVLGAAIVVAIRRKPHFGVPCALFVPRYEVALFHIVEVCRAHLDDIDTDILAELAQIDRRADVGTLHARECWDLSRDRNLGCGPDDRFALFSIHDREVSA